VPDNGHDGRRDDERRHDGDDGRATGPRMMQMRGEMMKAMGEIMIKHGKAMEGTGK
jgi:hypothetical protein